MGQEQGSQSNQEAGTEDQANGDPEVETNHKTIKTTETYEGTATVSMDFVTLGMFIIGEPLILGGPLLLGRSTTTGSYFC